MLCSTCPRRLIDTTARASTTSGSGGGGRGRAASDLRATGVSFWNTGNAFLGLKGFEGEALALVGGSRVGERHRPKLPCGARPHEVDGLRSARLVEEALHLAAEGRGAEGRTSTHV